MASSSLDFTSTELSLIDCGISSLKDLPLQSHLLTINLHSNYIQRLENLSRLSQLCHLDVSSNQISRIEGLEGLRSLRTLNLSCNMITIVEGLSHLKSLVKINISFNQIDDVSGFKLMSGPEFKLSQIELQGNRIRSAVRLAHSLSQCCNLKSLTFFQDGSSNPLCHQIGYRSDLLSRLPQLNSLDGRDRNGQVIVQQDIMADIPGLEGYMDYLLSTSSCSSVPDNQIMNVITPKIDEAMESFKRRCQMSYDTNTSTSDIDTTKSPRRNNTASREMEKSEIDYSQRLEYLENQISVLLTKNQGSSRETQDDKESSVNAIKLEAERDVDTEDSEPRDYKRTITSKPTRKTHKTKVSNHQRQTSSSKAKKDDSKHLVISSSTEDIEFLSANEDMGRTKSKSSSIPIKSINLDQTHRQDAASTYGHLMKELETERERRIKSEQATKKLADYIKDLQEKVKEDQTIKDTAVDATGHLKHALMNEKEIKERLKDQNDHLKNEVSKLSEELQKSKQTEASQRETLKKFDETITHQEREKLQQDAHINKKYQEVQMKSAALNRELDMLRQAGDKQKSKIHALQELLANREQEHREELKKRYTLDSPQLQSVIDKEVKQKEREYMNENKIQQEKIDQLSGQYTELEDEFRMALQIEASRFQQVQEAFERICEENAGNKKDLFGALKKDEKASAMLKELSMLVKEQKGRIAELSKSKHEQTIEYKERVQTLEAHVEEARKRMVQFELLKKEKNKLLAEVEAQQSVIDGLKAERKLWGQELAQQGSSLAQDRGRLEAKIETLQYELNTMQKNINRETDIVKIKTKMIDDQTETIRKLKEGLLERDEEITSAREEALKIQKSLEEQLADEKNINQDNQVNGRKFVNKSNNDRKTRTKGPSTTSLLDALTNFRPINQLKIQINKKQLTEMIYRLQERKDDLKHQINDLQTELEESQKAHSVLNNKWREKSGLISELEQQVGQMKQSWSQKEKKLSEERDRAIEAASLAVEKLKSVDDTFRNQLESKDQSYQQHIAQIEQEKNEEIEQANRRVFVVEEEMRDLLRETENTKRGMEEKIKRMTRALGDLQSDLL